MFRNVCSIKGLQYSIFSYALWEGRTQKGKLKYQENNIAGNVLRGSLTREKEDGGQKKDTTD